ncbi:hypothetical protein ACQKH5_03035 [Hyphomonas sp. NPDC076900]|uniref:hypothetical protein n=1 Tax=unclassified Hyphomonas TaxID=2630699 RepID=UPI003D008B36
MALTCSGNQAAADPRKSGIDRASAHFNAALAFNLLADQQADTLACETSRCTRFALDHIERSFIHQEALPPPAANMAVTGTDQRFDIRRRLVRGAALKGASKMQAPACGTPEACLLAANEALGSYNWEGMAASEDGVVSALACRALSLRSQVNFLRDPAQESLEVTDLRHIVQRCPDFSAAAVERLAQIAFGRAEQLRASMLNSGGTQPGKAEAISLGTSAVASYTDALQSDELKLPAYRNMGLVHLKLAELDRTSASFYFEAAIDAFDAAQALSQAGGGTDHAADLERLGASYLSLADAREITPLEEETLINSAIRALETAILQAPAYQSWITLGGAYVRAGRESDAEAAYRAALALAGTDNGEQASLSLARLLEKAGKPAEALAVLEPLYTSRKAGPDLEYMVGRLRFTRADHAGVLDALTRVIPRLQSPLDAEAHYMAGISESILRRPGWQSRMLTHGDAAAQSNSFAVKYIRLDCLAHILAGGKDVRTAASLQRCPSGTTPERYLLRGMYFLKQAQLMDVSAYNAASQDYWRSVLRLAEESFRAGQQAAKAQPGASTKVGFDDLQREVNVEDMLASGLTVISRCRREVTIPPESGTWTELDSFFGHYGVLKCSAS